MKQHSYSTVKVLYSALLFFNLILIGLAYYITTYSSETESMDFGIEYVAVFGMIAATNLGLALFLPRMMASKIPNLANLAGEDLQKGVFPIFIIRMVLLESINIIGFVFAFLTQDFKNMIPFAVVSVFFMLMTSPSEQGFRKVAGLN